MNEFSQIIKTILEKLEKLERVSGYQQQQINNLFRFGHIESEEDINYADQKVRVRLSEKYKTAWLTFTSERAGKTCAWNPPDVGENVLIICPYGELMQGVVIRSFFSGKYPAPENDPDKPVQNIGDKISLSYDRSAGKVTISCDVFEVNCKTAAIKNSSGEAISQAAEALKKIISSKTDTMKGPNPLLPASTTAQENIENLESFSGG